MKSLPVYFLRAVKFSGESHWEVNLIREQGKGGIESGIMFGQMIDSALDELSHITGLPVERIETPDTLKPGTAIKNVKNCVSPKEQKEMFESA